MKSAIRLFILIFLVNTFFSCKRFSFTKDDVNSSFKVNKNFSQSSFDEFRKSFLQNISKSISSHYVVLHDASDLEIIALIDPNTELNQGFSLIGSFGKIKTAIFHAFRTRRSSGHEQSQNSVIENKNVKYDRQDERKLKNKTSIAENKKNGLASFVRQGTFTMFLNPKKKYKEPIEILTIKNMQNEDIPLRIVEDFDDIPVGTDESVYVSLTKRQYASVKKSKYMKKKTYTRIEKIRDLPDGGVFLKVEDNTVDFTKKFLKKEKPLMFDLDDKKHGNIWDAVKRDFQDLKILEENISQAKVLGTGSFGTAYLMKRPDGIEYVVKKMSSLNDDNIKEIALLTKGSCQDCLQYYGAIQKGHDVYLASEVASEGSLSERVLKNNLLKDHELLQIMQQGTQLSDNGLIHFDIKLENILIKSDGSVKIMDYGIAQRHPTKLRRGGSPHTMPPEVYQRKIISSVLRDRVHAYSIGMSILDGRDPSVLDHYYQKVKENNRTGQESNVQFARVPHPFSVEEKEILREMLEPDISRRISMKDALKRWEEVFRR